MKHNIQSNQVKGGEHNLKPIIISLLCSIVEAMAVAAIREGAEHLIQDLINLIEKHTDKQPAKTETPVDTIPPPESKPSVDTVNP